MFGFFQFGLCDALLKTTEDGLQNRIRKRTVLGLIDKATPMLLPKQQLDSFAVVKRMVMDNGFRPWFPAPILTSEAISNI